MGRYQWMDSLRIGDLRDALRVSRDYFRSGFDSLVKARNEALKNAGDAYLNERLREEKDKIKADYDTKLNALREECRTQVQPLFDNARSQIRNQVLKTSRLQTEQFGALQDKVISLAEARILSEAHAGTSYWTDRFLANIFQRSGIDSTNHPEFMLPPTADELMAALDSIETDFNQMLTDYGKNYDFDGLTYKDLDYLSNRKLNRFTDAMIGNAAVSLTPAQRADRIYSYVESCRDSMSRSLAVTNAIKSTIDDPDVHRLILERVARDNYAANYASNGLTSSFVDAEDLKIIKGLKNGKIKYHDDPEVLREQEAKRKEAELSEAERDLAQHLHNVYVRIHDGEKEPATAET